MEETPNAEPDTATETDTPAEPPDPQVVSGWLARIRPAAVLALRKEPDYGLALNRAFAGFRADAKGYANPMVRSRLVREAVKDAKLAEKLRDLAAAEAPARPTPPAHSPVVSPISRKPPRAKPDPAETLRAERDQRRRERDEARQTAKAAEAERDQAVKALGQSEAEREDALRQMRRQAERIGRLERQVARFHQTEARLIKALNEDKVSPPPTPARSMSASPAAPPAPASPWLLAVRHLLDKGKRDQSLALAEDVLKADPEDVDALDIAAQALEGKLEGKREAGLAAAYTRRLLAVQISRHDLLAAADSLLRLLRGSPAPETAEPDARRYLAALSPNDARAVETARRMLTRLLGSDPATHRWLTELITAQTSLGPVLMPPPEALGPDDPLPLAVRPGESVTARLLADAADRGRIGLLDAARAALLALQAADTDTYTRVWAALEQAAGEDLTRLIPLRRAPRGPVVVDASNVAWFDQESLTHGKPRLRHLLALRRTLRERGFSPVVLTADANLPYFIDEPSALRAMRDRQELTLVDAGVVADEVLLRTAKHLSAPLVTNDKMEDWDPRGEVLKVRYTISPGGEVALLSEI